MSAPRDKGTAAQQPQLLKILENLLKLPENKECVDCGTKAPRWASTNLGIFMCIRCSGIHRSMGVHISKVKSVSLDKWSPEQVEFMQQMGNAKAKEIYESYVPSTYNKGDIRNENIALEQWIRDKYERKRFMSRDGAEPATRKEYKEQKEARERTEHRGQYREPHRESRESNRDHRDSNRDYRDSNRDYRDSNRDYRDSDRDHRDNSRDREHRDVARPIQAPQREVRAPAPAPTKPNPPAVQAPAPVQESFDLLNWDEPARTPQAPQPPAQNNDFFGDFSSAAPVTTNNGVAAPPTKDKNAILQLYNVPPVVPTYGVPHGMPPQHVYPGVNYNVHLQGNPGYPPNIYNGMPPNYNVGMGRGMPPPNYNMGPMGGVPPNYYNQPRPGYNNALPYGTQPGYQGYSATPANPNNLVNGLSNLNLRM